MQLNNIKLVIFDLDGTLLDAYQPIIRSFNFTMRSVGARQRSARTIRRAVGWGDENLLRPFVKTEDLPQALFTYRKHHAKALMKGAHLFPRAGLLLAQLKKKGYTLAVASNRPTRFSRILIRRLGIKKYFDFVLCADKLRQGKPHPEIIISLMRKASCNQTQTLYVGDMVIDAQAGRRAGVRVIAVATGSSTRQELKKEKPFLIVRKIADLLKIL